MTPAFWLQLAGLVAGGAGAIVLAFAYQPASDVHGVGDRPIVTEISSRAWWGGLFLVALGFVLQAAGLICGTFR